MHGTLSHPEAFKVTAQHFWANFNQIGFSQQLFTYVPMIIFHGNPSNGNHVDKATDDTHITMLISACHDYKKQFIRFDMYDKFSDYLLIVGCC